MHRYLRGRDERTIAGTRVGLAAYALFAIWLDPAEPQHYAALTYSLHAAYLTYSVLIAALVWQRGLTGRWPLVTHVIDILFFSAVQYLTLGPSSPFFVYFVFALFSGAIRWGWRGALGTAPAVVLSFVIMGLSMGRSLGEAFELNRFVIRIGYLFTVAGLLVYLGRHEARLRGEIEQLARWPAPSLHDRESALRQVLAHAATMLCASTIQVAWWTEDEPDTTVAFWDGSTFDSRAYTPIEVEAIVPDRLATASMLATSSKTGGVVVAQDRIVEAFDEVPLHAVVMERCDGGPLASAAFRTDAISGRIVCGGLPEATIDVVPLLELVGREVGASIEQIHTHARQQQLAVGEERIRVARDLHDGVLQALTGVRLELQGIATTLQGQPVDVTRDRLLAMERALAIEQRELRRFIDGLRPLMRPRYGGPLADRLEDLRERVALEWKVPVVLRVNAIEHPLPHEIEAVVPQMVHEAVVNALKHGHPTRVVVDVRAAADCLTVSVSDDGSGFPFEGRYDHAALVNANVGPASLCERVASLGGEVSVESGRRGARVDITLPLSSRVSS
jgi:signal transduction histidine kinase